MALITSIALGAVAVGAAAYSAVEKKSAADDAASAQKKAVEQQSKLLKKLDPNALNDLARTFDESRAKRRLEFQKEIDPELAALRQQSKQSLLDQANAPKETRQSQQIADTLFRENKQEDPRIAALKDRILTGAEQALDAGANLPPEFQAELVRAGVANGSQAGIAIDKNAIGGGIARVLGIAGVKLQEERQDQAIKLTNAAQDLTSARVNILSSIFPKVREVEQTNRNEAIQNFALANAIMPESGISGQDAVNIEIAKNKAKGNLIQQQANIKGQQAQDEANFNSALAGAAASGVTGAVGAYAGGAGGGVNYLGGGGGAPVDVGVLGKRTPQQSANFQYLQNYYQ